MGQHNHSSVNLGRHDKQQAAKSIEKCDQLGKTARGILYWVLNQDSDNLSVSSIKTAFRLGDKAWFSQRTKFKEMGILTQTRTPLTNGSTLWSLDFDFRPLYRYLEKGGDHVRARDPCEIVGSRSPSKGGDHARVEGINTRSQNTRSQLTQAPPLWGEGVIAAPQAHGEAPSRPQRAGLTPERNLVWYSRISENSEARNFFKWLWNLGVKQVRPDAMVRKISGARGAPLAEIFGVEEPSNCNSAVYKFDFLLDKLLKSGKKKIDLQVSVCESSDGFSRSILVDDLSIESVEKLKKIWKGPAAILETSLVNFQAILIMDSERPRVERKLIQQKFAILLGGDSGATSSTQLHRFPGSVNWKGEPFICRLIDQFSGSSQSNEQDFLIENSALKLSNRSPKLPSESRKNLENFDGMDASAVAFGRTIQLLRMRVPDSEILAELCCPKWLRHHHPIDWPERTLRKAKIAFRPPAH